MSFLIHPLAFSFGLQSRLQIYDLTGSVLCSASDVPEGGFPNSIPMVLRGNCTFYEKVRLAQINGARGILIVSKDRLVSKLQHHTNNSFRHSKCICLGN